MTLNAMATPEQVALVNDMIREVRHAFQLACAWDHIEHTTMTVVQFSKENPYVERYNRAMEHYLRYRKEHNV